MNIAVSFSFYHFACILLLIYKPGPKFAIRSAQSLSDSNASVISSINVTLTNIPSHKFLITHAKYVVRAEARRRQYHYRLQYAIQYLYGAHWYQTSRSEKR
jgi:hypothetical protein